MNLTSLKAALKARFQPVLFSHLDQEVEAFAQLAKDLDATSREVTGAGRAIASMTEGKGE